MKQWRKPGDRRKPRNTLGWVGVTWLYGKFVIRRGSRPQAGRTLEDLSIRAAALSRTMRIESRRFSGKKKVAEMGQKGKALEDRKMGRQGKLGFAMGRPAHKERKGRLEMKRPEKRTDLSISQEARKIMELTGKNRNAWIKKQPTATNPGQGGQNEASGACEAAMTPAATSTIGIQEPIYSKGLNSYSIKGLYGRE